MKTSREIIFLTLKTASTLLMSTINKTPCTCTTALMPKIAWIAVIPASGPNSHTCATAASLFLTPIFAMCVGTAKIWNTANMLTIRMTALAASLAITPSMKFSTSNIPKKNILSAWQKLKTSSKKKEPTAAGGGQVPMKT